MDELILVAVNNLIAMLKETNKKLDALAASVCGTPFDEWIVIETDEENPVQICKYENGEFDIADGYRVRIKPKY